MNKSDITRIFDACGYVNDSAATQIHHYTTVKRKSLTKAQVDNRNSTGWGRGEYIIAEYDQNDNCALNNLIDGWKKLASKYQDQFLVLEVSQNDWRVYDSNGNELGDNSYIENLFSFRAQPETIQKIYFGCPGTGKSYEVNQIVIQHLKEEFLKFLQDPKRNLSASSINKIAGVLENIRIIDLFRNLNKNINSIYEITAHSDIEEIFKDDDFINIDTTGQHMYSCALKYYINFLSIQTVFRTTFHPDTDYASFVGCYKPTVASENNSITYEFCPQIFTEAYIAAWENPNKNIFLVIEEINRGNCAQIFGDIFQLLDRKNGLSEYPVKADKDLADYLDKRLSVGLRGIANGNLQLPPNFNILATMNTSDQSLFPMDSAFKRRWDWEYIPIDLKCQASNFTIDIDGKKYSWLSFLEKVNDHILRLTESEDKQLGNFFIKKNISKDEFKSKVMFYLWSEVCKDYYNSDSFFKYNNGHNDIEFTFNMLFSGNDTTILQGFMKKLDVTEI